MSTTENLSQPDRCEECSAKGTFVCIEGMIYGPCGYEDCYSWCSNHGDCRCECHG